jgi:SulP family sulfate permease
MVVPVSCAFCTIIFRDPVFLPLLPQLVRLVLFSSAIHQICFSTFSSLPFAIGQVQDAGLVFLSAMASDIAVNMGASGASVKEIVATTIVTLSVFTAALGALLMVVARLKLASLIQYLPMPVIGGYLAFIGFFCGLAGLEMMSEAAMPKGDNVFDPLLYIILVAPGIVAGVSMYIILSNSSYFFPGRMSQFVPYILPGCMATMLFIFYSSLYLYGGTMEDARSYGWVAPAVQSEEFYKAWELFSFSSVHLDQMPGQILRWFGMFLVVAFSSSLDVAAIEMELGLPLDYNR